FSTPTHQIRLVRCCWTRTVTCLEQPSTEPPMVPFLYCFTTEGSARFITSPALMGMVLILAWSIRANGSMAPPLTEETGRAAQGAAASFSLSRTMELRRKRCTNFKAGTTVKTLGAHWSWTRVAMCLALRFSVAVPVLVVRYIELLQMVRKR